MLSVTLFLVTMQPIFRILPDGVDILLYADDIFLVVTKRLKAKDCARNCRPL